MTQLPDRPLRPCHGLGLRSRQHALSASLEPVFADRCEDDLLCLGTAPSAARGSAQAAETALVGQLWQDETFQPCRLFVDAGDTTGARTGAQRRDRGRARVLKWLNNRLMFGWMEFNSSGYYREHLWALLNLVDFALDEEVRTKATMAVDLMLFDVTRYLHRGAMGAAGGRSQFKSKSHGFDNGLTDVVEIMLGVKGVFS